MTIPGVAPRWRLLILDDARFDRALLRAVFDEERIDLIECQDAEHGLAMVRAEPPDLILLGWRLPGGRDGDAIIRLLKEDPRTTMVPVIFIAGGTTTEMRAHGLDLGAVDFLSRPLNPIELRARVRAALRIKAMQDQLERRAYVDGLTGLANRLALDEWCRSAWASCLRRGAALSTLMVDLDYFKQINDQHGHGIGDEALRWFARKLREVVRLTDFLARYGGEEFVVMALDCTLDGALLVAERIRGSLQEEPLVLEGRTIRLSASIGVASTVETAAAEPGDLIAAADRALYGAKHAGRNSVWHWDGVRIRPMPPRASASIPAIPPPATPRLSADPLRFS
jgi:diguanylate cyclase (GGDEF)-like protein